MVSEKGLSEEEKADLDKAIRAMLKKARDRGDITTEHFVSVPRSKIVERLDSFCAHHCHGRDEGCDPERCPVVQVVEMIKWDKE